MAARFTFYGVLILIGLIGSNPRNGNTKPTELEVLKCDQPIIIDGRLEEESWQHAPLESPLVSYRPTQGDTLPFKTEIWLTFDAENIYVGFRCADSEPEKIKTAISQRDKIFADDWVGFSLDALGNCQSAYDFFVNPHGIQGDILNSAITEEDIAPDFVWESAGQLTSTGYQVEIKVPLRSIRFQAGENVKMGILFWRQISRLGMAGSWPTLEPGKGMFNLYARLNFGTLKCPLNLEILPGFTWSHHAERETPETWGPDTNERDFGLGIKFGLTSSITSELTLNPDFSQVESDAFQIDVNRRFPNFFPEKRPFFMEGLDILNFLVIPYGNMRAGVHTRQIGAPRWGSKLTGTTGKSSFGVLAASDESTGWVDEDDEDENPHPGKNGNYLIARTRRTLTGDSFWGAIYSGREFGGDLNHVVGVDGQHRFFENQQTTFSILQSFDRGVTDAAFRSGNGLNFTHRYQTKKLGIIGALEHYDSNFNMESAFMFRTGITNGWVYFGPNFFPTSPRLSWLKRFSPQIIYVRLHDFTTRQDDSFFSLPFEFSFSRQGFFLFEPVRETESWEGVTYDKKLFNLMGMVQLTKWLGIESVCQIGDWIYYDGDPPFLGKNYSLNLETRWQPGKNFTQNFDFFHEDFYRYSDGQREYRVNIINSRTTYQINKYLFIRATLRYDGYEKLMLSDFLASFTLIPGTVLHLGYGAVHQKLDWKNQSWVEQAGRFYHTERGLFFKASYLWRY